VTSLILSVKQETGKWRGSGTVVLLVRDEVHEPGALSGCPSAVPERAI
jgi:hypothetical protein